MQKQNELTQLLVSLAKLMELGNPIGHRNLTLVPLMGTSESVEYILAQEAIQDGLLAVKEVSDSGDVNVLVVENKADKPVLLLDGEELVGAKQNRILNTTILIAAKTTQKIPVSCVEQGRWRHVSTKFSVGNYASPEIRCNKSRRVSRSYKQSGQAISDQGEVWRDVDQMVTRLNAHAPTRAMKDAFEQRATEFDSFVKALPYPEGTRGVMAAVSGRFTAMDALDRPMAFKTVWSRLVAGYALDAIGRKEADAKPFNEKNAQAVLEGLGECTVSSFKAVGLGQELRFESDVLLGQALVVDGVLVHISIFPNERRNQDEPENAGHIMPPSVRRRLRREWGIE